MIQLGIFWVTISLFWFFSTLVYASPYGFSFLYPIKTQDIDHLHGYRVALTLQPKKFIWKQISVYFDGSYGHWWIGGNSNKANQTLNILALAPYLRIYIFKKPTFSPYVEASIGLAYLTKTYLADYNLGMHFIFQDQVGIGIAFGPEQRLFTTLGFLHYSNGALCGNNAGLTSPITITMGYRF